MRQALNSNPVVQIAVIGVLVVVVGLFLMMNMKKKGDSGSAAPPADASAASTAAGSSGVAGTTAPVQVPGTAVPSAGTTGSATLPPPTSGAVSPEALVPGPGLPRPVITAWKGGHAVVLLVVRGGGIDDKLVKGSAKSLSGDAGVSLFVTRVKDVARYSRITQGVGLDHAPALVVVRPRAESDVPQATVSYGFRDTQSVVQAVHDALYTGRDDLPYYPR
jgi:hypothetical protein